MIGTMPDREVARRTNRSKPLTTWISLGYFVLGLFFSLITGFSNFA